MTVESTSNDSDGETVSVLDRTSQPTVSIASEVERLALSHFIINSRGLGGYLLVATASVIIIVWGLLDAAELMIWLAMMSALCLVHWRVLQRFQILDDALVPEAPRIRVLFAAILAPSVVFGASIAGFGPRLNDLGYSLIALVQLALCTAVMIDMAAIRWGFLWFAACVLGPGIVVYSANSIEPGGGWLGVLALILCGLLAVLSLVHDKLYRLMQAGFLLTVEQRIRIRELEDANRSLYEDREILATESRTDVLTGLANRRLLEEGLGAEWNRCRRSHLSLSCVLLDIDHFKAYNDHFGHDGGDECLKHVARILDDKIRRAGDFVARYGGEEFMVLLPNTDLEGGRKVAEQLHASVLQAKISHPASPVAAVVSISLGVACLDPESGMQPAQLFKAADLALYEAKRQGRNRVELASRETLDSARLAVQGLIG